jgi:hypothetical protein
MRCDFDSVRGQWAVLVFLCSSGFAPLMAQDYARAGYRAVFTEPGSHMSKGSATIVDERTLRVEHFTYDGGAPLVYFYLGATNSQTDFVNGIPIGPELDRAYQDETVVVQLPEGQTLDGYTAISVWCVQFSANFASATFVPPYARADQQTDISVPGLHSVQGTAIILDERTIHIEHFYFDNDPPPPSVYFYLGEQNTQSSFVSGMPIGPQLTQAYSDASVIVQLPAGQRLDGYGALSVWCVDFSANFGSGAFPRSPSDLDIDGDGDADDFSVFQACVTGAEMGPPAPGCELSDIDGDNDVDLGDFGRFQRCLSGPDIPADPSCE